MEGLKGAGMSINILTSAVVVFLLAAAGAGLIVKQLWFFAEQDWAPTGKQA